jgi:hypothetical protein
LYIWVIVVWLLSGIIKALDFGTTAELNKQQGKGTSIQLGASTINLEL